MRSPRDVPLLIATGLLVLAVLSGLASVVLFAVPAPGRGNDPAQDAALFAARQAAVNVNSYDYTKIDQQFSQVTAELTGTILDNFNARKAGIKTTFTSGQATSVAKVLDAAPVTNTSDEATVLVSLVVGFTPKAGQSTKQNELLSLHLVRDSGRWLVDTITTVT